MPPIFQPTKENELVAWSSTFNAQIALTPTDFGLTAAQALAYGALHTAWVSAYNAVQDPNTNTKQAVIAKNQAKENLLYGPGGAWELVNIVQAFPGTTDAERGELGLRIPDDERTPIPAPTTAPVLSIVSTAGRSITVRLRDLENPDRRGKPDGVVGATVLYHVSNTLPPNDPAAWTFAMNTSKTQFEFDVPASVPGGSTVWLTAFWFNNRKQSSNPAPFQFTRITEGLQQAA
jgi:hypothetical protein